jgi:hypothetical protein
MKITLGKKQNKKTIINVQKICFEMIEETLDIDILNNAIKTSDVFSRILLFFGFDEKNITIRSIAPKKNYTEAIIIDEMLRVYIYRTGNIHPRKEVLFEFIENNLDQKCSNNFDLFVFRQLVKDLSLDVINVDLIIEDFCGDCFIYDKLLHYPLNKSLFFDKDYITLNEGSEIHLYDYNNGTIRLINATTFDYESGEELIFIKLRTVLETNGEHFDKLLKDLDNKDKVEHYVLHHIQKIINDFDWQKYKLVSNGYIGLM